MDERDARDPLRDLEKRLNAARRASPKPASDSQGEGEAGSIGNALAMGLRIGLELVVAIIVCAGIGWAADHWLGTRPVGMIVGFFFGVVTGMVNVYRAVTGMGLAMGYRRHDQKGRENGKDDWSDDED